MTGIRLTLLCKAFIVTKSNARKPWPIGDRIYIQQCIRLSVNGLCERCIFNSSCRYFSKCSSIYSTIGLYESANEENAKKNNRLD